MKNVRKVPPTIMPPHESPNITYEQALEAWRQVKAEEEARRKRRKKSTSGRASEPRS